MRIDILLLVVRSLLDCIVVSCARGRRALLAECRLGLPHPQNLLRLDRAEGFANCVANRWGHSPSL